MTKSSYAIPCNFTKRCVWRSSKAHGTFTPRGNPAFSSKALESRCSIKHNPAVWESDSPTWSARIFVGFNVGETPTYSMDHLVTLVKGTREKQGSAPDSSFIYQKGIYTHSEGGPVVTEEGAQVIILNLDSSVTVEKFTSQMVKLAETIAKKMQQESVVVEMQEGGVSRKVIGVVAE